MPVAVDLRRLSLWCSTNGFSWTPARSSDGQPAVLLARQGGCGAAFMLLLIGAEDWRLLDDREEVIAAASSLDLLLDAADAGFSPAGGLDAAALDGAAPFDWTGSRLLPATGPPGTVPTLALL